MSPELLKHAQESLLKSTFTPNCIKKYCEERFKQIL